MPNHCYKGILKEDEKVSYTGYLETSIVYDLPDEDGPRTKKKKHVAGFWFKEPKGTKWKEICGYDLFGDKAIRSEPEVIEFAKQNGFIPDPDQQLPNYFSADPTPSK